MLTKSSWVKIVAVALLCLVICGGFLGGSFGCTPLVRGCTAAPGMPSWGGADYPNAGNASIQASQVRNIELEWFAGRVEFNVVDDGNAMASGTEANDGNAHAGEHEAESHSTASHDAFHDGIDALIADSSEIRLEENAGLRTIDDGYRMRWALDGDTLRIAYCGPINGFTGCSSFNWPSKTLVLTIPKSACAHLGSVSINAFSGDYSLDDLSCQRLAVNLASGRIDGSGTAFDVADIDMASGTFNLEGQIANSLNLDMASGDANITCSGSMPRTMEASLASGNATLIVPEGAGITATLDKISGSFNFDVPDSHTYDESYICGDGFAKLDVDMTSGNFTVRQ